MSFCVPTATGRFTRESCLLIKAGSGDNHLGKIYDKNWHMGERLVLRPYGDKENGGIMTKSVKHPYG